MPVEAYAADIRGTRILSRLPATADICATCFWSVCNSASCRRTGPESGFGGPPLPRDWTLGANERLVWAVAYHDLSWELLRLMVQRREFACPAALEQPGSKNMLGVCAVSETYPPFLMILRKAYRA